MIETERYPDCENCSGHTWRSTFSLRVYLWVTMRLERGRWHGSLHGLGVDRDLDVFPSPENVPRGPHPWSHPTEVQ